MRGFGVSQRISFGASVWHSEAPTLYNFFYHALPLPPSPSPYGLYPWLEMVVVRNGMLLLVIRQMIVVTL